MHDIAQMNIIKITLFITYTIKQNKIKCIFSSVFSLVEYLVNKLKAKVVPNQGEQQS